MIYDASFPNDIINTDNLCMPPNDASLVSLEDVDEYPLMEATNNILRDVADMFGLDDSATMEKSNSFIDVIADAIRPTPIGPSYAVRVVDEVPLMQVASSSGSAPAALLDCLRPLLRRGSSDKGSKIAFPKPKDLAVNKRSLFHFQHSAEKERDTKKRRLLAADGFRVDDCESLDQSSSSSAGSIVDKDKAGSVKIRAHQSTQWNERYNELVEYQREFGHCVVPYHYKQNAKLALWVKRQRHQYKLKHEGQHSTMSDEREAALEHLGFVWDSHKAVWQERINELIAYREKYGHCNVPAKFAENSQLAIWVKCQRRQYKLFCAGERSNMTEARIRKLSEVGFVWDPRSQF